MTRRLSDFRRIVVKIGSATLVDAGKGKIRAAWLAAMADDIARLGGAGAEVLVVSSGAIALGRNLLKFGRRQLVLEESQAAAAVGQIGLARAWSQALDVHNLVAGQILLTLQDTEERRRYLNARATIETLLANRSVPVINENDTVATSEIRYGDNDRLAARVASMMSADCLVLLSDIDGLYTAPPARDPTATLIEEVTLITPEIEAMAGVSANELARGGMTTKIEAAKIALASGTHMVITSGGNEHPLARLEAGGRATWFVPGGDPVTARKAWIAGALEPRGAIIIDEGAVRALKTGKSLLPAGVVRLEGHFARGDAVIVKGPDGHEVGRGLVAYDAGEALQLIGKKSHEIAVILGFKGRSAMIHRDDLALAGGTRP